MRADPYAPPHPDVDRATPPAYAPGRALAIVYGAAIGATVVARTVTYYAGGTIATLAWQGESLTRLASSVAALAWLYAAWKGVPASHRGSVSPRRAALSMFIPLYNAYWALAVNAALCDTLNGILERARSERRAPRTLGIAAAGTWLGSFVVAAAAVAAHRTIPVPIIIGMPVVPGSLWLAYMVQCDAARHEVARLGDRVEALGAPKLSPLQRTKGPNAFVAIGGFVFLFVVFLAIWQLLAPAERPVHDAVSSRSST
jgi:hypothetical protein